MKAQITEREARDYMRPLYCIGYCGLQETLRHEDPIYYTAGIYGRKADYYRLTHSKTGKTIRISTGYGPTGKRPNYRTIEKIERHSRDLRTYSKWKPETIKRKIIDFLIDKIEE